jgi:hypothetical protein
VQGSEVKQAAQHSVSSSILGIIWMRLSSMWPLTGALHRARQVWLVSSVQQSKQLCSTEHDENSMQFLDNSGFSGPMKVRTAQLVVSPQRTLHSSRDSTFGKVVM